MSRSTSQKVNFPVREKKSIYGWGAAQGSAVRVITRQFPASTGKTDVFPEAVSDIPFVANGTYTISDMELFAGPGQQDMSFAVFTYRTWMTPQRSSGSLTDAEASNPPSDAFFTQTIADITAILNTPDGTSPFLSFEGMSSVLNTSDFDPITLGADGLYTTHLKHAVSVPYTISTMIPAGMNSFSLFQVSEADTQIAAVPEPSTFTLFIIGVLALLGYVWRRNRTRSTMIAA